MLGRRGKNLVNGGIEAWWRLQPFLIALCTGTGVPLVPNGQELGEEHMIREDDHGTRRRIMSRPLRWTLADDAVGQTLADLHRRLGRVPQDRPGLRSALMRPGPGRRTRPGWTPTVSGSTPRARSWSATAWPIPTRRPAWSRSCWTSPTRSGR